MSIDDHYEDCPGDECRMHGCPPPETSLGDALNHFADDEPTGETVPVEGVALMAALMQKSSDDLQWTNNQLIDGYKRERDEARAELAAVRDRIGELLQGPYSPSSFAIADALWPSRASVERYLPRESER